MEDERRRRHRVSGVKIACRQPAARSRLREVASDRVSETLKIAIVNGIYTQAPSCHARRVESTPPDDEAEGPGE